MGRLGRRGLGRLGAFGASVGVAAPGGGGSSTPGAPGSRLCARTHHSTRTVGFGVPRRWKRDPGGLDRGGAGARRRVVGVAPSRPGDWSTAASAAGGHAHRAARGACSPSSRRPRDAIVDDGPSRACSMAGSDRHRGLAVAACDRVSLSCCSGWRLALFGGVLRAERRRVDSRGHVDGQCPARGVSVWSGFISRAQRCRLPWPRRSSRHSDRLGGPRELYAVVPRSRLEGSGGLRLLRTDDRDVAHGASGGHRRLWKGRRVVSNGPTVER